MNDGQTLGFGTLLRRARRAAGLTQEEVAEHTGVSVRTISDLERGVNHSPHTDTIDRLAGALGLQGTQSAAFAAAARGLRASASPGLVPASRVGLGSMAPFVGRNRELALLDGIWPDRGRRSSCWQGSLASARRASYGSPAPEQPGWASRCWRAAASGAVARSPTRRSWPRSKGTSPTRQGHNNG